MSKQFWAVIVAVILVFVAILALGNKPANTGSGNGSVTQHIQGLGQDHVTLVEYGDYQCPFCGQYYPILKQVQALYNTQMTFQFRNYPLVQLHQNAFAGARAAEAAALQNKFWQMHDLLYQENQTYYNSNQRIATWVGASNPVTYFDQYATQLGLNVAKFNQDYASNQVNGTINADMAAGNALSTQLTGQPIQGTPTFFIDGKQVNVGESVGSFQTLINAEIAKKSGHPTSSTNASSAGTTSQTKK
jgi:protein-disulfide isomerase